MSAPSDIRLSKHSDMATTYPTPYDLFKTNLRKKYSQNKLERSKTGGGEPKLERYTDAEEKLLELLKITVTAMEERFDDDAEEDVEPKSPLRMED
ncbi:hypothetical protein FQA39_LY18338 [Lamprigera yunnana]|nr:hypothetical protein FQA39_LY18338 [Lamprigera yunnana]